MSAQDRHFIDSLGISIAKFGRGLKKSRQTIYRGIMKEKDYIKPGHLLTLLHAWKNSNPGLCEIIRKRLEIECPEVQFETNKNEEESTAGAVIFPIEPWEGLVKDVRRISTRLMREHLAETLSFVQRREVNSVIMTKNGVDTAGVVSVFSLALLAALRSQPHILEMLQEACPELGRGP